MAKKNVMKPIAVGLIVSFLLFYCPYLLKAQEERKGDLFGYVYDKDGTTPIKGAIVKIRNIQDGTEYESAETDIYGAFRIEGIKEGFYVAGVITPTGKFNADNLIGIRHKETAKASFALISPQEEITSDPKFVSEEFPPKNEVRIGKIVAYDSDKMEAWVLIEEGTLHKNDRIRIKGFSVDFYQEVDNLWVSQAGEMQPGELEEVESVIAGQTVLIKVKYHVEVTDFVYLVKRKRGPLALFAMTAGTAAVLVGGMALITGGAAPGEGEASPFRH